MRKKISNEENKELLRQRDVYRHRVGVLEDRCLELKNDYKDVLHVLLDIRVQLQQTIDAINLISNGA